MSEMEQVRSRLAEVDRRLLGLVAERQRLAAEAGRLKEAIGRGLRDFAQEREVISRAREEAERLGLPPGVGDDLMRLLIRSSLTEQERQRVARRAEGSGRRALVIGGAGRMGRWFVDFLASQGFGVEVADPAGSVAPHPWLADYRQSELDHDLIVVAASLHASNGILLELARRRPRGLLFDIGSLKRPLAEGLSRLVEAGVRVTSLHPMFGPETALLSGRHVIFVDVGVPEAVREARELFDSTLAIQVEADLESHDRLVAWVLGLSHALNIAFFTALAESGESVPRLAALSSTTFDAQLAVASRVAEDNPDLYFEIQQLNQYGDEPLEALAAAVARIRDLVMGGDRDGFVDLMRGGRRFLATRGAR